MPNIYRKYATIAVLYDKNHQLCAFTETDYIRIMKKTEKQWIKEKDILFSMNPNLTMFEFRQNVQKLANDLKKSSFIVAGREINGLSYHILDNSGLIIFEINHLDEYVLNGILLDILEAETIDRHKTEDIPTAPVSLNSDGIFYINMMQVQQVHPEISTKKALIPFLEQTPFLQLHILCSHMPVWLSGIEYADKYIIQTRKQGTALLVVMSPKACNE